MGVTYTNASHRQRTHELWGVGCTSLAGGMLRISIGRGLGPERHLVGFACVREGVGMSVGLSSRRWKPGGGGEKVSVVG